VRRQFGGHCSWCNVHVPGISDHKEQCPPNCLRTAYTTKFTRIRIYYRQYVSTQTDTQDVNVNPRVNNYLFKHFITMKIWSRNKAQVNKSHYFSWPKTPCLRQQPHENKNRSTRHPHTQISSEPSMIATDNNMGTCIIHYSIELVAFFAEYTLSTTIVILI
jgi:hypothetical protein